jgi:hypothetical protein
VSYALPCPSSFLIPALESPRWREDVERQPEMRRRKQPAALGFRLDVRSRGSDREMQPHAGRQPELRAGRSAEHPHVEIFIGNVVAIPRPHPRDGANIRTDRRGARPEMIP